ncbi:MAG: hypothetical protein M0P58_02925 [Bacteroidales bacterium]|nr:hypothetical protein [Bacteroidales bacterium]
MIDFINLAPVTPDEATFESFTPGMISIVDLAPVLPSVVDFNDQINTTSLDIRSLAPTTPTEADFEWSDIFPFTSMRFP